MKTETYLEVLMDAADLLPDYEKENLEKVMSKKCCKDDIYETGIGGRLGFLITEIRREDRGLWFTSETSLLKWKKPAAPLNLPTSI